MKMKQFKVDVVNDAAMIQKRRAEGIEIEAGGKAYSAANLMICTGSEAFVPPIPGVQGNDDVLTNREILQLKEQPKSLVIIGGGVIGMEFASIFNSLGTKVTIIEMLDEILTGMDKGQSDTLKKVLSSICHRELRRLTEQK